MNIVSNIGFFLCVLVKELQQSFFYAIQTLHQCKQHEWNIL